MILIVSTYIWSLSAQLEIVSTQDYATRRFAEVISTAVAAQDANPQERLIALRARLVIAERQFSELKTKRTNAKSSQEKEESPKIVHIRAAESRVDHFQLKISQLEREILKAQSKKPSSKKK